MNSITAQWLERADYDLATAESLLKSRRYLYVAFMCQQCIEKIIKAYITSLGKSPPLIHNLPRLAEEAELMSKIMEDHKLLIADLNPYYIKARYGEYKDELSRICDAQTAKDFIVMTKGFVKWLRREIK